MIRFPVCHTPKEHQYLFFWQTCVSKSSGNGFRTQYPFTRVKSLRIQQATAARRITSSLLSKMVQLIVSQSSCSEAAKMLKKCAIFKHNKVSPSIPCAAEHVTSNSGKRSDSFHSTSENSENLNRWLLLSGKRPPSAKPSRYKTISVLSTVRDQSQSTLLFY